MTVRNLEWLFRPGAIALVGASTRKHSVGALLAENLLRGGFDGPVMPVNPKHRAIAGVLAYPDVASLPVTPDLAIIATPPEVIPGLIAALGARGTRAAVVITAGFRERGPGLRQAMLDAARPHLMRIVGPNCLGLLAPAAGINASFAPLHAQPGRLAFVAQSGAVVTAVLDWAQPRGIGFSHLISLGDMADVDFGDMLDYLASDPGTDAVLLYMEAVTNARKFLSAARAAARAKPVVVVKAGRHGASSRAAASHTGALAGNDAVYDAVFRRTGMLRVDTLDELFAAAQTLASALPPAGERVAILSNGGGLGVMAADALLSAGGTLATLGAETVEQLNRALPPGWSHANPVDIIGDADAARHAAALEPLLRDPNIDAVLVLHAPVAVTTGEAAAEAVISTIGKAPGRTLLTSWVGGHHARAGRAAFAREHLPTYDTPEQAVRAFMHLADYRRRQEVLRQTPPSAPHEFVPDRARVRALLDRALERGGGWLDAADAVAVVAAYGVPVLPIRVAADPAEAAAAAREFGTPVALKARSPDLLHKSDVGGVALNLPDAHAVQQAAQAMLTRIAASHPQAQLQGFTVQAMAPESSGPKLIVGIAVDPQFGPVVLFGAGGVAVEQLADTALGLPPLNLHLARDLMDGTRVSRLLAGYRNQPRADLDAIALTLVQIAQLAMDFAEVQELDINPLQAGPHGVLALDVRVRIAPSSGPPSRRLAIRPYPVELEQDFVLWDGRTLRLRPIRPEDEPALQKAYEGLTPQQQRLRFFAPMKALRHATAARLTQIDYDREMALVLTDPAEPPPGEILAVVRLAADPDQESAEYAITVGPALVGHGVGLELMRRLVAYAAERGIRTLYGLVLPENAAMLAVVRRLGFTVKRYTEDRALLRVSLDLTAGAATGAPASPPGAHAP